MVTLKIFFSTISLVFSSWLYHRRKKKTQNSIKSPRIPSIESPQKKKVREYDLSISKFACHPYTHTHTGAEVIAPSGSQLAGMINDCRVLQQQQHAWALILMVAKVYDRGPNLPSGSSKLDRSQSSLGRKLVRLQHGPCFLRACKDTDN